MKTPLKKNSCGFTLVELLVVLLVIIVLIGTVYMVFFSNYLTLNNRIARAQVWQNANEIIEQMTYESRDAHQIQATSDDVSKAVTFLDKDNNIISIYQMDSDGKIERMNDTGSGLVLSEDLDFENSDFEKDGKSLKITLAFKQASLPKDVNIQTSTKVYLRN